MARGTNPGIKIPGPYEASPAVCTAIQQIVTKIGFLSSPKFSSITLAGLSGVLKATAGVISGSATLDDVADGTSYERVAAAELSSGIYKNATTAVKGIASFNAASFTVTDGAVSLAAGGGLSHNDLGGLQGGTAAEYYHLTSAEHVELTGWLDNVTLTSNGVTDWSITNTVASGEQGLNLNLIQGTNPLTGTLRGIYSVVTNGEFASTGIIRAIEGKARAALSDLTGGNITTLEGMSLSADAKNKTVATLRGAEIVLDGQSGASVTTATGLRISNNFQANIATTSYGLHISRDSFDYTSDILLSKGGTISGDSYLNQDCRITASPTFAGLTVDTNTLYVDVVNHRLGVGTSIPFALLSVAGNMFCSGVIRLDDAGGATERDVSLRAVTSVTNLAQLIIAPVAGTNIGCTVSAIPRGIGAGGGTNRAQITVFNTDYLADAVNYEFLSFRARGTDFAIFSGSTGSGSARPIYFSTNSLATVHMVLSTSGQLLLGKTSGTELFETTGKIRSDSVFNCNGTDGITTTFVDNDGNTITVTGGIITAKTAP